VKILCLFWRKNLRLSVFSEKRKAVSEVEMGTHRQNIDTRRLDFSILENKSGCKWTTIIKHVKVIIKKGKLT
jgi:hypothetical protein